MATGNSQKASGRISLPRGIRRFSVYILSVLILILSASFIYNLRMQSEAERLLIDQEARAVTQLFESMQLYLSDKQDLINQGPDGSYHFKGLNPEAVGKGVADIFNRVSDHKIKLTNLTPRNPSNLPDEFEKKALVAMQADAHLMDYAGEIERGGDRFYYFVKRVNLTPECMDCHGKPRGTPDITGHPSEGRHVGDFGGAISVQIPFHTLAQSRWESTLVLLLFTLGLAGASLYLISYFLKRINTLSRDLALKNEELEQHNRRLEELERLKGELFHMLVHDMKAPLTFMIGSLQMLQEQKDGPLNSDQGELVSLVLRGCNRLEGMITNILDINRLEEGKLEFNHAPVDLVKLITEKEKIWRHSIESQDKSLVIDFRCSAPSPFTDRHLLERILENLVSNAIKHTRSGRGRIRLIVKDWAEPKGVLIQVCDNGEGIPTAYREKIFDKYTTAKQQELGMKSDTGLGLTFCKMATTALGGDIWLEDDPESGTCFSFCLPSEARQPSTDK
jgi:two-component system sensor histidine kinase BarA